MAKSNPRSARGAAPARAAAKSKKVASPEGAEVAEETGGMGIDAGVAVLTSLVLVAALVLVDMIQGKNGDGILY